MPPQGSFPSPLVLFDSRESLLDQAIDDTAPRRHDHTIPNFNLPIGPLLDYCDRGILWDPLPSSYRYVYDAGRFRPADGAVHPTAYLRFNGRWGDQQYPDSDPRQRKVLGIGLTAKFGRGPTGPRNKQLDRRNICPDNVSPCWVRPFLTP